MNRKDIFGLVPINKGKYINLDLDRLVVFVMVRLDERDIPLTLENIIVGSFILFPEKFSLPGYPQFPDSTRVEKALWRSKGQKRQWIGGKNPFGYSLNQRSHIIEDQVQYEIGLEKISTNKLDSSVKKRRRRENIINDLLKSTAYNKFLDNSIETITLSEFCYLLQGTLDSPKNILRENLDLLINFSEDLKRPDIKKFLKVLEISFEEFLSK